MRSIQSAFRESFPVLSEKVYLDNAGAGIPPVSVTEAMLNFVREWSEEGEKWEKWLKEIIEVRSKFASLIGASSSEVALVPSVSYGLASLASSIDLSNRKVITSEFNFPTNILLWQRMKERGLVKEVKVLRGKNGKILMQDWKKSLDSNVGVLAVDYVSWFSGYRESVQELADQVHKVGAFVFVDGFHATGVFPFNVKTLGVDAFLTGFYKWMCGPHGAACLYASREFLEKTEPAYLGWHGVEDNVIERVVGGRDPFDRPFSLDRAKPSKDAARYEWGTWASVVVRGVLKAIEWTEKVQPSKRYTIISELRDMLLHKLEAAGFKVVTPREQELAGIVTFKVKDHVKVVEKLKKRKIIVSGRYNHIRVSPHFYNTFEDIEAFLDSLDG
jgi:selenocysteine lyase/cysteine desulfurase